MKQEWSHLFFADNISIDTKYKCMNIFTRLSGQKKSIFSKYCNEDMKLLVKRYFNISPSTHFGKYLGFPILNSKPKSPIYYR